MWFTSCEITQNTALLKKTSCFNSAAQVRVTQCESCSRPQRLTAPKKCSLFVLTEGKPSHYTWFSKIQQKQTPDFLRPRSLLNHTVDHLPSFTHGTVCWWRPALCVTSAANPCSDTRQQWPCVSDFKTLPESIHSGLTKKTVYSKWSIWLPSCHR